MSFSEDFAHFTAAVPGYFLLLVIGEDGPHGQPLHSSDYDFNDALLPHGRMRDGPKGRSSLRLGCRAGEADRRLLDTSTLHRFDRYCRNKATMVRCWSTRGDTMSVQKQSVSFTDTAYSFAKELVEAGEYPNVSAAVSGELAKAKAERDRERALLEAELERRLSLPFDQWEPVGDAADVTAGARAHLTAMAKKT
jgi:Arc/MetJ-type ribon-helix-helix transcriptional regulator